MKGKIILYVFGALSLLVSVSSCKKDMDNHLLDVLYPKPFSVLYADQTADSITFTTFDSYTIKSYADWISVYGEPSYTFDYDRNNIYYFTRYLKFSPNTTGHTRASVVGVNSYEYSTGARYYQVGFLDIIHPYPDATSYVLSNIPDSVTFNLTDSANVQFDSLVFNVENYWSVDIYPSSESSWLSVDTNNGEEGHRKVHISMTPNKDMYNDRKATLILTSGEVSNKIFVRQLKATKEQFQTM